MEVHTGHLELVRIVDSIYVKILVKGTAGFLILFDRSQFWKVVLKEQTTRKCVLRKLYTVSLFIILTYNLPYTDRKLEQFLSTNMTSALHTAMRTQNPCLHKIIRR